MCVSSLIYTIEQPPACQKHPDGPPRLDVRRRTLVCSRVTGYAVIAAVRHLDSNAPTGLSCTSSSARAPHRCTTRVARSLSACRDCLLCRVRTLSARGSLDRIARELDRGGGLRVVPLRDVLRIVFRIEGKALHIAHGLGSLGLLALPFTGAVSRTNVLNRAWMGPFAIMGAAQAMMHQNNPRNAKQAAALQRFAASLPGVCTVYWICRASRRPITSSARSSCSRTSLARRKRWVKRSWMPTQDSREHLREVSTRSRCESRTRCGRSRATQLRDQPGRGERDPYVAESPGIGARDDRCWREPSDRGL